MCPDQVRRHLELLESAAESIESESTLEFALPHYLAAFEEALATLKGKFGTKLDSTLLLFDQGYRAKAAVVRDFIDREVPDHW